MPNYSTYLVAGPENILPNHLLGNESKEQALIRIVQELSNNGLNVFQLRAKNISDSEQPATGSEDFADMLKVVPGAYCRIGHSGTTGLHNPSFFLDPSILPVGASVMARIAERRLSE